MSRKESQATFGHPTPELPVADVERAQQHYRDALGFEIRWLVPGKEIVAVSRRGVAIFFRRRSRPFEPAVNWVFAADIDAAYEELRSSGARIVEPLEKKPWGFRQFTAEDIDGNRSTATEPRVITACTRPLINVPFIVSLCGFEVVCTAGDTGR